MATQMALWTNEIPQENPVVNVAQIPLRSPFRYPGGKTWLIPHLRRWLRSIPTRPKTFIEPFVGGGIVSLTVAFENLADRIIIVELDQDVAALWQTILGDDNEWLAERVLSFDISLPSLREELATAPSDTKHHGFQKSDLSRRHPCAWKRHS